MAIYNNHFSFDEGIVHGYHATFCAAAVFSSARLLWYKDARTCIHSRVYFQPPVHLADTEFSDVSSLGNQSSAVHALDARQKPFLNVLCANFTRANDRNLG
jgi:hypothetical protein